MAYDSIDQSMFKAVSRPIYSGAKRDQGRKRDNAQRSKILVMCIAYSSATVSQMTVNNTKGCNNKLRWVVAGMEAICELPLIFAKTLGPYCVGQALFRQQRRILRYEPRSHRMWWSTYHMNTT